MPKKAAPKDWHRADIVAALRKRGWSLRRLSLHHGYLNACTLTTALNRPWPRGERLIAEAIGVPPTRIWPSRYPVCTPQDVINSLSASPQMHLISPKSA